MRTSLRIKGVMVASLTAFNDDLSVDSDLTLEHIRWLLDRGADGVLIFGTAGEANSLSVAERLAFLEKLSASDLPKNRLMVGTGCCALPDTVALTRASLDIGIEHVLMLPPFFYKNPSDEGLFTHFSRTFRAIGSDVMKVYLYHFPQVSAVPFSHDLIARLLKEFPDTICGVKDSSGDFENMKAMAEKFPGFDVFAGTERFLLDTLMVGGVGTITATGNVTVGGCAKVYSAWKAGSGDAEALQDQLTKERLVLQNYPSPAALKELLAKNSSTASWRNVRAPFMPLPAETGAALVSELDMVNFTLPAKAA